MRVISGSARRTALLTPKGTGTRPTQDRIKETLFNMLQDRFTGGVFVDLFAGSGQMGIEALSRGASQAVFVEQDRPALECIRRNLQATHLSERADVLTMSVFSAIADQRFPSDAAVIFLDPPYDHGLAERTLQALSANGKIGSETLVVAECSLQEDPYSWDLDGLKIQRIKDYKTNRHVFLSSAMASDEES